MALAAFHAPPGATPQKIKMGVPRADHAIQVSSSPWMGNMAASAVTALVTSTPSCTLKRRAKHVQNTHGGISESSMQEAEARVSAKKVEYSL
jgi:hypothetical protein